MDVGAVRADRWNSETPAKLEWILTNYECLNSWKDFFVKILNQRANEFIQISI